MEQGRAGRPPAADRIALQSLRRADAGLRGVAAEGGAAPADNGGAPGLRGAPLVGAFAPQPGRTAFAPVPQRTRGHPCRGLRFRATRIIVGFDHAARRRSLVEGTAPGAAPRPAASLREAGVDGVATIGEGDAFAFLRERREPIDFVFLDAEKEDYAAYLELIVPLLPPGGLLIAEHLP